MLDSLDNFSTDNLVFDGYLVSADIFPDINQPLKVQPDYSLGFYQRYPGRRDPAYAGKGKFYEESQLLSNAGLRGKGITGISDFHTLSDNFHFYPDTLITVLAKEFNIDRKSLKLNIRKLRRIQSLPGHGILIGYHAPA